MPYVPSCKTNGHMNKYAEDDREVIDAEVVTLAQEMASKVTNNYSVLPLLLTTFDEIVGGNALGGAIKAVAEKYEYEGAYLGELNYAITRLIQEFPKATVKAGVWKEELRYWLYAIITEALIKQAQKNNMAPGESGVFEDIKDEYKVRVNESYEHVQIKKSGDCYDAPYYSRVMNVVGRDGELIGTVKVNMVRSEETLNIDVLPAKLIAE